MCRFRFRHHPNGSAGSGIDFQCLGFTEVVAALETPFLVFLFKCLLRQLADAFSMPERFNKIHPFLAAVGSYRAGKQAIYAWKHGIQQRDQVVTQHGLNLGILLILPIAGF